MNPLECFACHDALYILEKHCFLFVFHAQNQNSQDFPCFELTAKMTSLRKNLGVHSAKNLDMFTSIPTHITKSLGKLHFARVSL